MTPPTLLEMEIYQQLSLCPSIRYNPPVATHQFSRSHPTQYRRSYAKTEAEHEEILMRQGKVFFIVALASVFGVATGSAQQGERTTPISAPTTPLTSEAASRGVTKFSLIGYGDTRGRRDGKEIQYEHSLVIDSMLAQIKKLQTTDYPVKFVLQSGDAVPERQGREPVECQLRPTN
jgi:hypothetical protein